MLETVQEPAIPSLQAMAQWPATSTISSSEELEERRGTPNQW